MSENDNIINLLRDQFEQVNARLDKHYELFEQHVQDDKQAYKQIEDVATEVKVAKRVFYVLSSASTAVLGWVGLHK